MRKIIEKIRKWDILVITLAFVAIFFGLLYFLPGADRIPIDHMDTLINIGETHGWDKYGDIDDNCAFNISIAGGLNNTPGIKFNYNFKKERTWCCINRAIDFSEYDKIETLVYHYNGSGAPNSIELKLLDTNERTWGYIIDGATATDGWITAEINVERDIKYWWGGKYSGQGSRIDLDQVKEIHFAVSNKPEAGDELGEGVVIIDELYGIRKQNLLDKLIEHWVIFSALIGFFIAILTLIAKWRV
jgi:hypothetical protein